jgi:phosphate transport system protein
MTEHIVSAFEDELTGLGTKIAQMGGMAEEALALAIEALEKHDTALASRVIDGDANIDRLEREIEEQAIVMIARRQPMALDLREIMVAIRIAAVLERAGDLAKNIAKRAFALDAETYPKSIIAGLTRMGRLALRQLKDVLDAYAQRDAVKALEVWGADQEVDDMYNSMFRELLTYMMEDPRNIGICTHLLFGAKNLERIGDHATNIAENVYYLVHGEPIEAERPKGDLTSVTPIDYLETDE